MLSGTELVEIQAVTSKGMRAASTETTTTQDIANLGGGGSNNIIATGSTTSISAADRFSRLFYATDFGAKCDVKVIASVGVVSGTHTATSTLFTASDVGKTIVIKGVGTNGNQVIGNNGTISRNIVSVVPGVSCVFDGAVAAYSVAATNAFIGGTDDTIAINAALAYINSQGGGKLMLNGATLASQITLYRNCCLAGTYEGGTWLLQKTGSNVDFILTENFAALVGQNLNYGTDARVPSWFGLKDLYIDCQSTQDGRTVGNTAGRGVCYYGDAPYMDNVFVTNAAGDGIFTEGSSNSVYSVYDYRALEEGYFNRIECRENGGNGWTFHGRNDSRLYGIVCSGNGGYNFYSDADFASGFHYNGGCYIDNLHTYFSKNGTGVRFGACMQVGNLYIDTDNITFDTYSFGSVIGSIFFINGGYKNLDACIFNADNITIGNITGTTFSAAPAGFKFLNLNSQNNISIGNALIDLSASSNSATAVYSHGTLNRVTATVRTNGTASKTGMDIGGTQQVMNLTGDDMTTGVNYSTNNYNIINVTAQLTGSHTAFNGSPSATDIVSVISNVSAGKHGFLMGTLFQVQTFTGSEKIVYALSVRMPVRTVTAAGTATIAPNTDYQLIIRKTVGAATPVNLPTYPANGDEYIVVDGKRDAGTNNITLTPTGGQTINGAANVVMNVNGQWAFITFDGTGNEWVAKVV